jgi:hypothetical protein
MESNAVTRIRIAEPRSAPTFRRCRSGYDPDEGPSHHPSEAPLLPGTSVVERNGAAKMHAKPSEHVAAE